MKTLSQDSPCTNVTAVVLPTKGVTLLSYIQDFIVTLVFPLATEIPHCQWLLYIVYTITIEDLVVYITTIVCLLII